MKFPIYSVYVALLLFFASVLEAQNTQVLPVRGRASTVSDTIPNIQINESDLDHLDLRKQFERLNSTYAVPFRPNQSLLRFLKKDEPTLSPEALYWARLVRDASTLFDESVTYKDTVIVSPVSVPQVFRGNVLPADLKLSEGISYKSKNKDPYAFIFKPDTTLFADYYKKKKGDEEIERYLESKNLASFNYSKRDLPGETVRTSVIRKPVFENLPIKVEPEIVSPEDLDAPAKFIPDRQYWQSAFESTIQFSQSHISDNWHLGGTGSMNLFTKNHLKYNYNKDKVQFTNELEIKIGFNNAPKDTLRSYRIADNLFRIYSNFGYQAFNKWYYTLNAEFRTPFFKSFKENTENKITSFLAPLTVHAGLGMKYALDKKNYKTRHKNLKLNVNIDPISFDLAYTIADDIDFAAHGFRKEEGTDVYKHTLLKFGSTVRADMTMNFNRNISWQSRLLYFTSYEMVKAEFENTLVMRITRHFDTRLYVYLRHDDTGKRDDNLGYFQLNEQLTLGFTYKW